jgi:predicted nucleotide-binding protein
MERPPKLIALQRLQNALKEIPSLKQVRYNDPEFDRWCRNTRVAITNTFGEKSIHIDEFNGIRYSLLAFFDTTPYSEFQGAYIDGLSQASSILQSMIDEVDEYWEDDTEAKPTSQTVTPAKSESRNVFIVHGYDNGAKDTVGRFITKLGLNPIILHEQPNQGRTIIEKFEDYADPAYAIAILSPDDVGAPKTTPNNLRERARQNVIFELAYFIGKLGRKRACGLRNGEVEIPSGYPGVLYIPLDSSGAWQMKIVRELKAAGINVDANLAF